MSLFRRREPAPPPVRRQPHPDARTEAELQRIISLRKAVARREFALDSLGEQIGQLREDARMHPEDCDGDLLDRYGRDVLALETEITGLHDEIAARIGKIDDSDLAWLEGSRA